MAEGGGGSGRGGGDGSSKRCTGIGRTRMGGSPVSEKRDHDRPTTSLLLLLLLLLLLQWLVGLDLEDGGRWGRWE